MPPQLEIQIGVAINIFNGVECDQTFLLDRRDGACSKKPIRLGTYILDCAHVIGS
jgi:hypothetical protein